MALSIDGELEFSGLLDVLKTWTVFLAGRMKSVYHEHVSIMPCPQGNMAARQLILVHSV
jgi:hypothetical protein